MCYMQLQLPAKLKEGTKATCKGVNASTDAISGVASGLLGLLVRRD